ncbi:hypothetical protein PHSY_003659 [Pseudozyma hubeiensis SY62]|uniref:Uncharacterized protein n=1 Tax=Pseudozyma hubeiensis (strain SY62) TaxID=1305764 RepID=R9PD94_PSEHS|nr:hypothetical protein PHSY_003659 [Pseudozyma hubeiensis SY62]GAC96080.1 hypothetical protein PHSY_003659 [Pseudozyma hubeiensis SY62]
MRDRPCLCGCGSNAAGSSRRSSYDAASTGIAARGETSTTRTGRPPSDASEVTCSGIRPIRVQSRRALSTASGNDAQFLSHHDARSRPWASRSRGNAFILLPALICACLVSVVAAIAPPAPTPALRSFDSLYASNTTTFALPTASPDRRSPDAVIHKQLAAEAVEATTSNGPPDHNVNVQVSQPTMCQPMNITFDPSRGTPPYTVMISIEDYWPVTISLPASYDDATKDLWLYQYSVPFYNGNTANPNMIVSVTDSTGLMSNSSSFVQALSPNIGDTCPSVQYDATFYFYTEHPASMCQDYEIFWNGSYAPPITTIFLPESAPPINVQTPSGTTNNMTWQVAMTGGTRFLMTMADSRASGGYGGVSKLNIVALNEYVNNSCIAKTNYAHNVFAPTITAARASIFPDATSTVASLTTDGGMVATVTVIETIKNGRRIQGGGGGLSGAGFLILMVVLFASIGLIGAAVGWFCFRRHQKRKQNIRAWDLPNNDPSVPFSADPNMPIAPGIFGRSDTRQDSNAARARETRAADRNSISDASRPLTHAPSARASLRSWTSSAYDHWHAATGTQNGRHQTASTDDYAMMDAAARRDASSAHSTRITTTGNLPNGSRDAWSPTDSIQRAFGFYSDDPHTHDSATYHEMQLQSRTGSPPVASRTISSDGGSTKSTRVGPGPTYRPDAASQAAYQDLLASNTSPVSGTERTFPFSSLRPQTAGSPTSPISRNGGWAEVSEGADQSTRIVRHADAGLLLDDNDNGDELINLRSGRLMELPPQYDTIHPGTRLPQQRPLHGGEDSLPEDPFANPPTRGHAHGLASVDISDARNSTAEVHAADLVDDNDDESAFWAH